MRRKQFFVITRLHRDDLKNVGLDSSKVDDHTMKQIAKDMANDYCEQLYHSSLKIIASEKYNIPQLKT